MLSDWLKANADIFNPIFDPAPTEANTLAIDLSASNPRIKHLQVDDREALSSLVFDQIKEAGKLYAAGGYGENRSWYQRSELFSSEGRSIHLGIDLWASEGTPVYAPLPGKVYAVHDNKGYGNYGPTIILKHELKASSWFSLYGHLSRADLDALKAGTELLPGDVLGHLGAWEENGCWPPHVHFQLITDMGSYSNDFPGVAAPEHADKWLSICPDPNWILRIEALN